MGQKKRTVADDLNAMERRDQAKKRYESEKGLGLLGFRETVKAAGRQARYEVGGFVQGTSPMREMGEKISFEGRRFGAGPIAKKGRKRKQA